MRIGHASIDENKRISGGIAGDQTGSEVCIRSWYSKPWDYVLRAKDPSVALRMADACEKGCNNKCIGYDQKQRNSLRGQAVLANYDLSKIRTDCETDCSAFMTVCAECAGIKIPYSGTNAPTTSTMKSAFLSTGQFDCLTDSKYRNSPDYLKRGDILVRAGSHTAMALDDGSKAETNSKYPVLYRGLNNDYVWSWQMYLNISGYDVGTIDGIFGSKTENAIRQYQTDRNLPVDGRIDYDDWLSVGKG